jgi:hypothetical protein
MQKLRDRRRREPARNAPARFAWQRAASEVAQSTGRPLIRCQPAAMMAIVSF